MYNPGLVAQNLIKFVPKGWGYEWWIDNNEKYCGKLLFIKKGKRTSWHYHNVKEETLYVHSGELTVYYGQDQDPVYSNMVVMKPGDVFFVPQGLIHQLGPANEDTQLFEFSTQHFDDDSIRLIKGD